MVFVKLWDGRTDWVPLMVKEDHVDESSTADDEVLLIRRSEVGSPV